MTSWKALTITLAGEAAGAEAKEFLYWSDKQTDQVSDVPSEARIEPARFGQINIGK